MKTTKRKKFIKFLIDLGIDVDSMGQKIEAYYKNEWLFIVSDLSKYQVEITGNLKYLGDENIDVADLYMNIVDYASLEIKDRFKDIIINKELEND